MVWEVSRLLEAYSNASAMESVTPRLFSQLIEQMPVPDSSMSSSQLNEQMPTSDPPMPSSQLNEQIPSLPSSQLIVQGSPLLLPTTLYDPTLQSHTHSHFKPAIKLYPSVANTNSLSINHAHS